MICDNTYAPAYPYKSKILSWCPKYTTWALVCQDKIIISLIKNKNKIIA